MRLTVILTRSLLRAYSIVPNRSISMPNPALRPEVVLSESNRQACVERIKSYKIPLMHDYNEGVSEAAVLVPLCLYKGELGLLYTLRSMKLSSNRGQVSFPGGMSDECDADLQATALRETWEELKIPKEQIDVWTAGKRMVFRKNMYVMPVLAYIGEIEPERLEINPDEVEEAFVVTLGKLCDPELQSFTRFREVSLSVPAFTGGKHRVWGITGIITHMMLECLLPNVYKHKFIQVHFLFKKTSNEVESSKTSTEQNITRSKL